MISKLLKKNGLIILLLLIANYSWSKKWIPIDGSVNGSCLSFDVIESNADKYIVKITIHGIEDNIVNKNGLLFHQLSFNDGLTLQKKGEPALPVISQFIGIPPESMVSAQIIEEKWVEIPNFGVIYPFQEPIIIGEDKDNLFFSQDVYKRMFYDQDILTYGEIMTWKGINNIHLSICPFNYFPKEEKLTVMSDFILEVSFVKGNSKKELPLTATKNDFKVFDNTNFIPSTVLGDCQQRKALENAYDYLIIVGNNPSIENSAKMKEFRLWKALKGFSTKMVSTATIGTDSNSIKSFIAQEYANGIRNVLFVGDHTKIPIPTFIARHVQSDHPIVKSDYWYGCIGGVDDYQASLPIGRFLANDLTQFTNMVDKTIKYESLYHDWSNKILLSAHSSRTPINFQDTLECIRNTTYTHPMVYNTAYGDSVEAGGDGATAADVYNYINNGTNLVTYNGHGYYTAWWLGPYGITYDVHMSHTNEMNDDTYSLFISTACHNGDFCHDSSLIGNFTRSNHCASAFVGGTVAVFCKPACKYLKEFYKALLNDSCYYLGDLNLFAHMKSLSWGKIAIDNAFCFVCCGDPSLEIWTGIQSKFQNIRTSITDDSLTFIIENVEDYNVNVVSEEGQLVEKSTSSHGICAISKPTMNCYISITKHDFIPYIIRVDVNSNYIQNETITGNVYCLLSPMSVGYDVTNQQEYGNVRVEQGSSLRLNQQNSVVIKNGFECEKGAELIIE